ncbi:hypothetical protein [Streptomyces sp. NBC_01589]|uniref:hypothetical protein n=1 Tax=unclassified Streptomyces TaxID=2593676 RepID=UPI0038672D33
MPIRPSRVGATQHGLGEGVAEAAGAGGRLVANCTAGAQRARLAGLPGHFTDPHSPSECQGRTAKTPRRFSGGGKRL